MKRSFISFGRGQLHCRSHNGHSNQGAGGVPLVMLHAAPGSARMLAPMQERFTQQTISIDLPGMGDSDALFLPPNRELEIADYAHAINEGLDHLSQNGFAEYDVYGTLSGVRVALELANTRGSRVRRVVLDGIGIPKAEDLPELMERYAPEFAPDINGNHLVSIFQLCRDQYLFYPWYARDAEHRRATGLPSAETLHVKVMEALKSGEGFRSLIRAAFRYDVTAALSALRQPALITADGATVRADLPLLEFPPAEPLTCSPDLLDKRVARISAFLA